MCSFKKPYRQIFYPSPYASDDPLVTPYLSLVPSQLNGTFEAETCPPINHEEWRIATLWTDGYYSAAKYVIEGIAAGRLCEELEGTPGVYLFRHYLELSLKFIVFHSKWLTTRDANASDDEIEAFRGNHSLDHWWKIALKCSASKIEESVWHSYDLDFVGQCIAEFEKYDQRGVTFRYHGHRFEAPKGASRVSYDLRVSFPILLETMEHCREVLEMIDGYLVESYGMNAEWESYLKSF